MNQPTRQVRTPEHLSRPPLSRRWALVAATGATLLAGVTACVPGAGRAAAPKAPGRTVAADAACAGSGARSTEVYRELPGVDPDLTSVDVYPVAGACHAPVVMWVHGGGYRIGDKSQQIQDKVKLFNEHGWILVSVNYRLTDPGQRGSAQYPDHYDDVASAVAWVSGHIAEHGGDPSRIALLGHSAGADIVSNVAVRPQYLAEQGLKLSALRCAGPLDTEGFDKTAANADDPDGEKQQWADALGNNPNYLGDTSASRWIRPGSGIPDMIGVVRGDETRQRIETEFLAKLKAAGVRTVGIDARSLSHKEVNHNIGAAGDTVMTAPLVDFLQHCLTA